jgi:hypothetical protein
VVDDVPLEEVYAFVNEVALIRGQWQVRKGKMAEADYRAMVREKIMPDLDALKAKVVREKLLEPRVVYGYFPCQSRGNELLVYDEAGVNVRECFTFPRQPGDRHLCLSDYFAGVDANRMDVVALQIVTMGKTASEHSARLFSAGDYKDYLYFHGLSVECAEALEDPDGPGDRGEGRPGHPAALLAGIPGIALQFWLRGLPESRRPGEALRPARRRTDRGPSDGRIFPRTRAEHQRDHRSPSRSQVFYDQVKNPSFRRGIEKNREGFLQFHPVFVTFL